MHIASAAGITWAGVGINFFIMSAYVNKFVNHAAELSERGTMFVALAVTGFCLSLAGVWVLRQGKTAGGIIAGLGGLMLVPLGLICSAGALLWAYQLKKNPAAAQAGATGTAAKSKNAPNTPASAKAAYTATKSVNNNDFDDSVTTEYETKNDSVVYENTNELSDTASAIDNAYEPESVSDFDFDDHSTITSVPLTVYNFADQRLLYGIAFAACIGMFTFILPELGEIPVHAILIGVVLFAVYMLAMGRAINLPVMALSYEYIECTLTLFSSPIKISYRSIEKAQLGRFKGRILYIGNDGRKRVAHISFNYIKPNERPAAKAAFKAKMREVGKFVE